MGLRPISGDEKTLVGECRGEYGATPGVFLRGVPHGPVAHQ